MAKLLLLATLLGMSAVSFAQDAEGEAAGERPAIYDHLRDNGVGHLLDFACYLRELLQDREFSDRVYKVRDAVQKVIGNGIDCAKEYVYKMADDPNNNLGKIAKLVNSFRLAIKQSNGNPILAGMTILPQVQTAFDGFDINQVSTDFQTTVRGIVSQCGLNALEENEADANFIQEKISEVLKKSGLGDFDMVKISGNEAADRNAW